MNNKKNILFCFLIFGYSIVFSQNLKFIYTKDSYIFESDLIFLEDQIPFDEQCLYTVSKNTKCNADTSNYSLSQNGYSVIYVNNEDGTEGMALLDDLRNLDSVSIPESIINQEFISSWTYNIIKSKSKQDLFFYEPYWNTEWKTSVGEKLEDAIYPSYFTIKSNVIYVYSYTERERLFLITKCEKDGEFFKIYVTDSIYSNSYKETKTDCFIKKIEKYDDYIFYLKQDGDYLKVYLNNKKDELIELAKGNVVECHNYLKSIASGKEIRNSNITWPRHADGTCDYDDEIKPPKVQLTDNDSVFEEEEEEAATPSETFSENEEDVKTVEEDLPVVKQTSSLPLVIIVVSATTLLLCIVIIIIARKKKSQ